MVSVLSKAISFRPVACSTVKVDRPSAEEMVPRVREPSSDSTPDLAVTYTVTLAPLCLAVT